jgi:hypothetical protein
LGANQARAHMTVRFHLDLVDQGILNCLPMAFRRQAKRKRKKLEVCVPLPYWLFFEFKYFALKAVFILAASSSKSC